MGLGDGVAPGSVGVGVGVLRGTNLITTFGETDGSGVGSEITGLSLLSVGIGDAQLVAVGVGVGVGVATGEGVNAGAGVAGEGAAVADGDGAAV